MNLGAFRGERLADLETEAAAAARHQDRLSGQRVFTKDIVVHEGAPPASLCFRGPARASS